MYNFYAKLIKIFRPKNQAIFMPKMFQYLQTKISPRGRNVLIPPILYTTDTYKSAKVHAHVHVQKCTYKSTKVQKYKSTCTNSSINIGSISFFSSSDTYQSHHLLGCHATCINSSFNSFLSALRFCLTKKCF